MCGLNWFDGGKVVKEIRKRGLLHRGKKQTFRLQERKLNDSDNFMNMWISEFQPCSKLGLFRKKLYLILMQKEQKRSQVNTDQVMCTKENELGSFLLFLKSYTKAAYLLH